MLGFITGYAVVQVVLLVVVGLLILVPFMSKRFEKSAVAQREYDLKKAEMEHQRWMEKQRFEEVKSGRLVEHSKYDEG